MSRCVFLFDLDSIITKQEILPTILEKLGKYKRAKALAESTMEGAIPFKKSFLQQVDLLKEVPVSEARKVVDEIKVNELLIQFIRNYSDRCYILTENLDVWIEGLLIKLGLEKNVFCSKAMVEDDYIKDVFNVVDKNMVIRQIVLPFVAVGNGNNDAEMIEAAEIGIGYGGVRSIAPSVLACASHAVYQEETLISFLEHLV